MGGAESAPGLPNESVMRGLVGANPKTRAVWADTARAAKIGGYGLRADTSERHAFTIGRLEAALILGGLLQARR